MDVRSSAEPSGGSPPDGATRAEQLKTRLSARGGGGGGGGDDGNTTPLCNGDHMNGQNGNHGSEEEAMETESGAGASGDRKDVEEEEDEDDEEEESRRRTKDENGDVRGARQQNGEDVKAATDTSVSKTGSSEGSKNGEGATEQEEEEEDGSKGGESSRPESGPEDEHDARAAATTAKAGGGLTEEERQRAADVEHREAKLKRIEDAVNDHNDLRPVAKLLYGIGMDLAAQHIYRDLVRVQTKKQSRHKLDARGEEQLRKLRATHARLAERTKAYQLRQVNCAKCGFRTESRSVIEWHLEFAHGQEEGKYECSLCDFETRLPAPFFFHMEAEHSRKGRVYMKKAFFSCPQCPYENNSKSAVNRHRQKCDKQFNLKRNQEPLPTDCDIPLKKQKSLMMKRLQAPVPAASANAKPMGGAAAATAAGVVPGKNFVDARAAAAAAAGGVGGARPGMSPMVRVNPSAATVQTLLSSASRHSLVGQPAVTGTARARLVSPQGRGQGQQIQGPGGQMYTLVNSLMLPQTYAAAPTTTLVPQVRAGHQQQQQQQQQQQSVQYLPPAQNISQIAQQVVAQVTQQHNAAQQQKAIQEILKRAQQAPPAPQQQTAASAARLPMTDAQAQEAAASNPKFEICEICGGFVKDRESLRIHFYWAHKVDIQKDVFARLSPHLKCDSCPQAFWTYQGLARHRQISHVRPREHNYRCYLCGAKNIENIITHLSAAHNVKLDTMYKTGKCLVCGLGFAGEKGLKRHIHTAHLELLKGQDSGVASSAAAAVSARAPELALGARGGGGGAGPQRSGVPGKAGGGPVPTGLFENAAKKKKMFEPVCSLCNIVFPSVESFTVHCNRLHVFRCWRCSDKWASAELLHKHWNDRHRGDVEPCVVCGERVTIGRPFVRHMKRSHLKDCSVVVRRLSPAKLSYYLQRMAGGGGGGGPPGGAAKPVTAAAEVIVLDDDDDDDKTSKQQRPPSGPAPAVASGSDRKAAAKVDDDNNDDNSGSGQSKRQEEEAEVAATAAAVNAKQQGGDS